MLLAIDIGNTNIHLGLWHQGIWRSHWRARTVPDKMPDEFAVLVRSFLDESNLTYDDITGVIIGSVVPSLTRAFAELVERYIGHLPLIVTHETYTGIRIDIDQPQQAGADRIINTAAAQALYGGPAIVIDFGTATTFDMLSADAAYIGGAIAPGVGIAHDALVSHAARLHAIDLEPPPDPIGRNTIHAMQSGVFWGYVALIEGMVQRLGEAMRPAQPAPQVIATGGLAVVFREHTRVIDIVAPQLTLDGLRIIYELNR